MSWQNTSKSYSILWLPMKFDFAQILDMDEHELGKLANHLGHDPKTHLEYYRLSSSTEALTTVSIISRHLAINRS